MNHLQSHHSVRDELGSESESYNQLSDSLCKASTSWLGKRIWSINFNGVLGTFYIIYGILVACSFFIGYLLWTYFFLEEYSACSTPPYSFLSPERWLNSFYSFSQLAVLGISSSGFQWNTLLPSHQHCAAPLQLLNNMLAGDGRGFFTSSRYWHKTIFASWNTLKLWTWLAVVQLCMREGNLAYIMEWWK